VIKVEPFLISTPISTMGFFDFFKKDAEPEEGEEVVRLHFSDVAGFLKKEFSEEMERSRKVVEHMYQRVLDNLSEIEKSLQALGSASFEEGDKAYAAANMVKDTFVKKALSAVNGFTRKYPRDVKADFTVLLSLKSDAGKALREMEVSPKQTFLLSRYFVKESQIVVENVKKAESDLNELKEFLRQDSRILKIENEAVKAVENLTEQLEEKKRLSKRCEEIISEIEKTEQMIGEERKKIEDLEKSEECRNMRMLEKELKDVGISMVEIKNRLTEELSPLKRPFKKLVHSMGLDEGKDMNRFIADPFTALTSRGTGELKRLLSELEEAVAGGRITIKKRERGKIAVIRKGVEKEIPELLEKYRRLEKKRASKLAKIKGFSVLSEKRERHSENVRRYGKVMDKLGQELKECEKKLERVKGEIEKGKGKLKRMLSALPVRVEILDQLSFL
jgi:DNA repair exonuclease SbcCD ATPase subunit